MVLLLGDLRAQLCSPRFELGKPSCFFGASRGERMHCPTLLIDERVKVTQAQLVLGQTGAA